MINVFLNCPRQLNLLFENRMIELNFSIDSMIFGTCCRFQTFNPLFAFSELRFFFMHLETVVEVCPKSNLN